VEFSEALLWRADCERNGLGAGPLFHPRSPFDPPGTLPLRSLLDPGVGIDMKIANAPRRDLIAAARMTGLRTKPQARRSLRNRETELGGVPVPDQPLRVPTSYTPKSLTGRSQAKE
jgi:hypothetical protein